MFQHVQKKSILTPYTTCPFWEKNVVNTCLTLGDLVNLDAYFMVIFNFDPTSSNYIVILKFSKLQ